MALKCQIGTAHGHFRHRTRTVRGPSSWASSRLSGPGSAGGEFDKYDYPPVPYRDEHFSFQGMGEAHHVAQAFMLAHQYGTPRVMSSYPFDTTAQGPPSLGARPNNPGSNAPAGTGPITAVRS